MKNVRDLYVSRYAVQGAKRAELLSETALLRQEYHHSGRVTVEDFDA
jgi:hypothetical protein